MNQIYYEIYTKEAFRTKAKVAVNLLSSITRHYKAK